MKLTKGMKIALIVYALFLAIVAAGLIAGCQGEYGLAAVIFVVNAAFWLAVIFYARRVWYWFRHPSPRPDLRRYCTRCGAVEERMFYARGNWFVCFLLCCCFLIPGIIYYVWMRSSEHYGCQKCGSPDIVPLDSPVARRALEMQG